MEKDFNHIFKKQSSWTNWNKFSLLPPLSRNEKNPRELLKTLCNIVFPFSFWCVHWNLINHHLKIWTFHALMLLCTVQWSIQATILLAFIFAIAHYHFSVQGAEKFSKRRWIAVMPVWSFENSGNSLVCWRPVVVLFYFSFGREKKEQTRTWI